jgi:hypothetical protein
MILPLKTDLINSYPNTINEDILTLRKEYFSIYNNLFCLKPLKEYILKSILLKFEKIEKENCNLHEVELTLFLLNISIPYADTNTLQDIHLIYAYLFGINFSKFQSKCIILTYFDISFRYIQYKSNEDTIKNLLNIYFSPYGLMNQDLIYSNLVSIILNKLIEKLKSNLDINIIEICVISFKQYFDNIIQLNNYSIICENAINFNSISTCLSIKSVSEEIKLKMYGYLFDYLERCFQIFGVDEEKFNEYSKIIIQILKSIGQEISSDLKMVFNNFFNKFITNFYVRLAKINSNNNRIKNSLINILQRLIIILGPDCFQFLYLFFNQQQQINDTDNLEDSIKLLSNLSQILKKGSISLIRQYFPYYLNIIKGYNIPKENISEISKNIISLFSIFVKLIANILIDIPEELFDNNFNLKDLVDFLYQICIETTCSSVNYIILY